MKPNLVPVKILERMEEISWTYACTLEACLNLELIKFWSQMDDIEVLFKKIPIFQKIFFNFFERYAI